MSIFFFPHHYPLALAVNKSPVAYILSPALGGLWRENGGSVNRLVQTGTSDRISCSRLRDSRVSLLFFLFPAPRQPFCVPFTFSSFPLSESPEQATNHSTSHVTSWRSRFAGTTGEKLSCHVELFFIRNAIDYCGFAPSWKAFRSLSSWLRLKGSWDETTHVPMFPGTFSYVPFFRSQK